MLSASPCPLPSPDRLRAGRPSLGKGRGRFVERGLAPPLAAHSPVGDGGKGEDFTSPLRKEPALSLPKGRLRGILC